MAKDPAFLFYSSDFLSGVSDLTMEERGQYITLLCLQHQKGRLSEKSISLNLGLISLCVRNRFALDETGNFYNERLEIEIEKRKKFIESRSNNGKQGGRGKSKHKASAKASEKLPENRNENEIEDINKNENESDFENIRLQIVSSDRWIEDTAMQKKCSTDEIRVLLDEFLADIKLKDDWHKGVKEIRKHFINWLNVKLKAKKEGKLTDSQEVTWIK